MTDSVFTRYAVVERLLALVRGHDDLLADVTVARGVPRGRTDMLGLIASGEVIGDELTVPTMRRDRKAYRDQYRVEVLCMWWAEGDADFDETDRLVEQLAEVVRDVCATNPNLTVSGSDLCVTSAVVVSADGPTGFHIDLGAASAMRLEVGIDVRIN